MLELKADTGEERYLVICLHGLGASGADLYPLARTLWRETAARWIFPDAPLRPVHINNGMRMRAWYDVLSVHIPSADDEPGIRANSASIAQMIDKQIKRGFSPRQIVLLGFSQGGAMALYTALRYPEEILAVVALSAYLPVPQNLKSEAAPAASKTPIFLGSGELDTVITPADTAATASLLKDHDYDVTNLRFPNLGHSISLEEMGEVSCFLHNRADSI